MDGLVQTIDDLMADFSSFMWGAPLLVLLIGGGVFFLFTCRFIPFRYMKHAFQILRGKYDDQDDPGDITHFQALSSALAGTVGMGNISGVAIAIQTGGPGALFWMWISAVVGMATKFFTCTLSILYRGKDDQGRIQGGPMYFIEQGLGLRFQPLAIWFSLAGLFGCLVMFQANQVTQVIRDQLFVPAGLFSASPEVGNAMVGLVMAGITAMVIFGGIRRIGSVASRLVPLMVLLYMSAGLLVLGLHLTELPGLFMHIIRDAFTGDAMVGGAVGTVIVTGVRRAAFSNEAGIGTEAMAHGAAKTNEPVREGLVAMLGPFIDTLIICTVTAVVILAAGVENTPETSGVSLTVLAFTRELGGLGQGILLIVVVTFSASTMFSYSYYGCKCTSYLFGTSWKRVYRIFYILSIVVGAMVSIGFVVNFVDGMYALMAIPTVVASVLLAPRVMVEARRYFRELENSTRRIRSVMSDKR